MKFQPGFRLSIMDVCILVSGILGAILAYKISLNLAFACLFVVGHFFLFCNVIRMSRIPELVWATSFIVLFIMLSETSMLLVVMGSLAITLLLTILELKKPSYHGVLWQKFNPDLPLWFESHYNTDNSS